MKEHFDIHRARLEEGLQKQEVVALVREQIDKLGFDIAEEHVEKPWGAYFRFTENSLPAFINEFFHDLGIKIPSDGSLSPKILIVAPHAELSWQYHHRRSELWKIVMGEVRIPLSETDGMKHGLHYYKGDIIDIPAGTRHTGIGSDVWSVIAEIWRHTDANFPSNEEDIVRVSDIYGRQGTNHRG